MVLRTCSGVSLWAKGIFYQHTTGLRTVARVDADEGQESLFQRFGLGADDRAAWKASGLAPAAFADWLTDRVARRPAGDRARRVYGVESVHDFARVAVLDALALQPDDRLLEIGCGGGLLLRDALRAGTRATGLDHSREMVELARSAAPGAELLTAEAERLPFPDPTFTAIAMSVVFFFFPEPLTVLRECRRVSRAGAALAVYTTGPELRGTPASPEPLASRGHFYEDARLAGLAEDAGFAGVHVLNQQGGQLLTAHR
jgi:SAM-dependent methyltransferase